MKIFITIVSALFVFPGLLSAQGEPEKNSSRTSEDIITYDIRTHKTDKAIPFDKRFSLQVLKFNTSNIRFVYAFEAAFCNGTRGLKDDAPGKSVADLRLQYDIYGDTLFLHFPPLKPGKEFDIMVVRSLTNNNLALAHKLNEALFTADPDAATIFRELRDKAEAGAPGQSYFTYQSLTGYQTFFNTSIYPLYSDIRNPANYVTAAFPNLSALQLFENGIILKEIEFSDNDRLVQVINENSGADILNGIKTIRDDSQTKPAKVSNFTGRVANIKASNIFLDSVIRRIDKLLSLGYDPAAGITALRTQLTDLKGALSANQRYIEQKLLAINNNIEADEGLSEPELLVGTTEAKDIKTKGGNLITFDAGFAYLVSKNIQNKAIYFPKLYYGVNIHFRPIDRNTRKKNFPRRYPVDRDSMDYNIAAVNNIWQHLSLTLGLTFGSITNSQFDNLYNGSAALIGPGYRIGRFAKISGGLALMKRTSKNPLISEKKVVGGGFLSLSVNIDLIQGVKDFTNMLFK